MKIPPELGRMSISPEEKRGGTPGSEIPKDVLHGLEFSGSGGFARPSVMSKAVFSIHSPPHPPLQDTAADTISVQRLLPFNRLSSWSFFPVNLARNRVGGKASSLSLTPLARQRGGRVGNLHPKFCKVCTWGVTTCG